MKTTIRTPITDEEFRLHADEVDKYNEIFDNYNWLSGSEESNDDVFQYKSGIFAYINRLNKSFRFLRIDAWRMNDENQVQVSLRRKG